MTTALDLEKLAILSNAAALHLDRLGRAIVLLNAERHEPPDERIAIRPSR
jgi:hypothetical protein